MSVNKPYSFSFHDSFLHLSSLRWERVEDYTSSINSNCALEYIAHIGANWISGSNIEQDLRQVPLPALVSAAVVHEDSARHQADVLVGIIEAMNHYQIFKRVDLVVDALRSSVRFWCLDNGLVLALHLSTARRISFYGKSLACDAASQIVEQALLQSQRFQENLNAFPRYYLGQAKSNDARALANFLPGIDKYRNFPVKIPRWLWLALEPR